MTTNSNGVDWVVTWWTDTGQIYVNTLWTQVCILYIFSFIWFDGGATEAVQDGLGIVVGDK